MAVHPQPLQSAELAPLPRAQVGPFILLGVSKIADAEAIEAAWAQRLIWARKRQVDVPLEDINWAREMLRDWSNRIRADAASLNVDTTDGVLAHLQERFQGHRDRAPGCQPIDVEKDLKDYVPPTPAPTVDEVRATIPQTQVPRDLPAALAVFHDWLREPLDPWDVQI